MVVLIIIVPKITKLKYRQSSAQCLLDCYLPNDLFSFGSVFCSIAQLLQDSSAPVCNLCLCGCPASYFVLTIHNTKTSNDLFF